MCDKNEKLAYLGPGYPLFFLFLKYCIAILSLFLLISGLYALYSNHTGTFCSTPGNECYPNYSVLLSLANKRNDPDAMNIQLWLNFALLLVLIILLHLMRRHVRKMSAQCDERDISAADYSVMIEHLPTDERNVDFKKELKELIEKEPSFEYNGKQTKFEVEKINLAFNLAEFTK